MLTVACVLRSGGDFHADHVRHLQDGVRRWLTLPNRFVCLTDTPVAGVDCITDQNLPPKWWGKLTLFKRGLFNSPVFFADLDTVIVGPLDQIVTGHRFTVLDNFWNGKRGLAGEARYIGSGLMAWDCDLSPIHDAFAADPARFMAEYQTKEKWGDQAFIRDHTPVPVDRWQEKHPGAVFGFKHHCKNGVPAGASVVCFGGRPRPWHTDLWGRT